MKRTALLSKDCSSGKEIYFVDQSSMLGSAATCEVSITGAAPNHCRVYLTREGYEVQDLTGLALVQVNGRRAARSALRPGDKIRIASEILTFSEVWEEEPERPTPKRLSVPRNVLPSPAPTPRLPLVLLAAAGAMLGVVLVMILLLPSERAARQDVVRPVPGSRTPTSPRTTVPEARKEVRRESAPAPRPQVPAVPLPVLTQSPASPPPEVASPLPPPPAPVDGRAYLLGLDALLKDPRRRGSASERAAMAESLRSVPLEGEVLRAAAIALSWPGGTWQLSGLPAQQWSAYVNETSFDALDRLSSADHARRARMLLDGGPGPLLRLFALAHLVEAVATDSSVAATLSASGFRQTADGKRWGEIDQVFLYRVTAHYHDSGSEDLALQAGALSSSHFATRYAGLLLEIRRSLATGVGLRSTFNDLVGAPVPGGVPGAPAHLRALADGFRKAVYCGECKGGRIACSACEGKGKADLPCPVCKGVGRVIAPGAVDGAVVSQRCNNCDGRKIFRQAGCPACSKSGSVKCTSCGGNPWRDGGCANGDCRGGWVRCDGCRGVGRVDCPCPDCGGTGRVASPGAAIGSRVTQKCRTCNEEHGVFRRGAKCASCSGTGLVRCGACSGKPGGRQAAVASLDDVFTVEPCGGCGGSGWPSMKIAVPCPRCLGLRIRVKPAVDPGKLLE